MYSLDADDESQYFRRNIKSNFGRKVGEPKLVGDDIGVWSKYYHSSYGQGGMPSGNAYYRDVYASDASDMAVKQKTVLGQMRDMKQVLNRDRSKLLDYTALLEDQYDTLYRMSRDPYYEFLLLKHPNYRDTRSYFPRRKEVNERLSKLDAFYAEKLRWAEENAMVERNQKWLESYLREREKKREKPKQTLNYLQRYLDETGEANRRIAREYESLKSQHRKLDTILHNQRSSIKSLEDKLSDVSVETSRRAEAMRHKFESEADMLSSQIAREKMLRHAILPRL